MVKANTVTTGVPKSAELIDDEASVSSNAESSESGSGEEDGESEAEDNAPVRRTAQKVKGKWPAYQAPSGMSALPISTASSAFEWNELAKKSGVELWCVRVPAQFKVSRLQSLQLNAANLKANKPSSEPLGTLSTSKNSYHLIPSLPSSSSSVELPADLLQDPSLRPALVDSLLPADQVGRGARIAGEDDRDKAREKTVRAELGLDGGKAAGAEEMKGLRLVAPDVRRGGLFIAPKQPTRHLVLAPVLAHQAKTEPSPTILNPTTTEAAVLSTPVTRHPQPPFLKYRNVPFGAVNPTTKYSVGGPGASGGKHLMAAPNAVSRETATPSQKSTATPSKEKSKRKEKDGEGEKKKKRKSTAATEAVEAPATVEKEKKRKAETSGSGKSKRAKTG